MKKNVLILSYGYPPLNDAGAQRPYALAKYLDKTKFNVTVLTCKNPRSPLGLNKNFDPTLDRVSLIKVRSYISGDSVSLNADISKNKSITSRIKGFFFTIAQHLMFPDKGMFWYPNVRTYLRHNPELIRATDVVFSTSPGVTNHRIARYVKRKNRDVQWIADFRDFNYVENWQGRSSIKAYLHKKLEMSIVREATFLTFVTRTMQRSYQKFYPLYQDKMHCVYNGFDTDDFHGPSTALPHTLRFFYAGTFYNGLRSPFPLMQLLDQAFKDHLLVPEEVQLEIAGNLDKEMNLAMKVYASYRCVSFLGNLPRVAVLQHMSHATFLWLIVAPIKSHYQTIPIKLFEYMAARRPIVNFAPLLSEPSQIIQKNELGYNFNTLDFSLEASYAPFKDLILKYREGHFVKPMPAENLDSFTWQHQIRVIENLL